MARKKTTRKKAPKRKTTKRKFKRKTTPRKTMAKRKSTRRKSGARGIASKIPVVNNPTFKKAAQGVGTATLGVTILSLVAPSIAQQPLVRPALAFVGGGIEGTIAQVLASGQGLNLFGGSGNGTGGGAA